MKPGTKLFSLWFLFSSVPVFLMLPMHWWSFLTQMMSSSHLRIAKAQQARRRANIKKYRKVSYVQPDVFGQYEKLDIQRNILYRTIVPTGLITVLYTLGNENYYKTFSE